MKIYVYMLHSDSSAPQTVNKHGAGATSIHLRSPRTSDVNIKPAVPSPVLRDSARREGNRNDPPLISCLVRFSLLIKACNSDKSKLKD